MSANYIMWKKFILYGGGIVGSGVLLYKFTTPTEEQLIARLSPELRAEYENNRQFRQQEQQELMKIVQETAASSEPIWKTGSIVSPWDRDPATQGLPKGTELLVKKQTFEKGIATARQLSEIEALKQEEERMAQASQEKSKWAFWKR
ncbi:unnamed protein product [Kuraishia capsulata CBS 1993]|uniref:Cytochrome b mRNA-processing protein 4 n=1 Tax=Kuraishia capsulata CBS 1993 TaxID=1382522 RepID=W6MG35_9ASCO|nr:uncharacterized protein KUCA_T00000921001 [Kuraishia capsulata CBS 1993]CDK24954.1 unnamed protein product [Kuraishia capsulata CBS 1993]